MSHHDTDILLEYLADANMRLDEAWSHAEAIVRQSGPNDDQIFIDHAREIVTLTRRANRLPNLRKAAQKAANDKPVRMIGAERDAAPSSQNPLDEAWAHIDALGGHADCDTEAAYCEVVARALDIIEKLGGRDPLLRQMERRAAE